MNKYLNADGARERIVPLWIDAVPQLSTLLRKIWCWCHGHGDCPTITMQTRDNKTKTTCGICCAELKSYE